MKPTFISLLLLLFGFNYAEAQIKELAINPFDTVSVKNDKTSPGRLNFYVISKSKTLDLFNRTVIWRAKLKARKHDRFFTVIVARSAQEAKRKIIAQLDKKGCEIGTLWFDSHGHYSNGYSSFSIGQNEFSYKKIRDSGYTAPLRELSPYCNENTNVVIGYCYGGATFERKNLVGIVISRMNGDSLVIRLAELLPNIKIYGTESWVMTKPGIFICTRRLSTSKKV